MSENHLACDDDSLLALLGEELPVAEHEAALDHLESCGACQQRLCDLIASGDEWNRVAEMMSGEFVDENSSPSFVVPAPGPQPISWTESMARKLVSPPTHPEMLGRLGRYDVERLIGSGGMGVVFKAFDGELNRPVAIKLLAPYLASSGPARKRFSREARAAAAVVHQHVVPIHNVETDREIPLIVMRFVPGESLQARVDRDGSLELRAILRIGMQVADGLSAAHQQGLVHRDIKPSNILLEEDVDHALISDFGLARAADDASLTRTGVHPGTPQYMSPEQAAGRAVDARSDLFSLGSMLYTMSTGRPPFRAESSLGVMRYIAESEPTPIRELNPSIPDWLCQIIARLMSKHPSDRFASALEVHELLEACLSHVQHPQTNPIPEIPAGASGPGVSDSRRSLLSGRFTMIAAVVAICLLFGSFWFPVPDWFQGQTQTEVTHASPLLTQLREAESVPDQSQRDQALAILAKAASASGNLTMTNRALEKIVAAELQRQTRNACAIALFQNGNHSDAYSLVDSIKDREDRNAMLVVLASGEFSSSESRQRLPDDQDGTAAPDTTPGTPPALFDISVNGKQGWINKHGKIVIEPQYQRSYPFREGLAAVQVDQRWGFIDTTGKVIIEPRFIDVAPFSDGRARVRLDKFTDPWGYIDTHGKIVIEPQYDCAEDFRNGIAKVGMQTLKGMVLSRIADVGIECDERYIDTRGQTVPKPAPEHYATGQPGELISFRKDGLVGYVDATGEVKIEPQFVAALEFSEGLACACRDDSFGFIDRTGEFVIPPKFPYANIFSDGLAGVPLEGNKWGFIDQTGRVVLPATYDWVYGGFREGLAKVSVAGRIGYINRKGEWVW